jgi:hypothetical protein
MSEDYTARYLKTRSEFVEKNLRSYFGITDEILERWKADPYRTMQEQAITREELGKIAEDFGALFDEHRHPLRTNKGESL